MSDVFDRSAKYYDLLYHDKNYRAEVEYVGAAIRKSLPDAHNILEFGAGTGRHARLLANRGFCVVGIEASEEMAMSAQQGGRASLRAAANHEPVRGSYRFEIGDIRSYQIQEKFDAVVALFHVISYQTSNSDLTKVFENAARHLKPRGIFFFDVWHGPAVLSQGPAVRVKRADNEDVRLTRIAEPTLNSSTNVVTVNYTLFAESKSEGRFQSVRESHHLRYLFPSEIETLARHSGFVIEHSEEFLTGATPSEQTWGVAYLLRKRD